MRVLALDLGGNCGFAVSAPGQPIVSGSWSLCPAPGESVGIRYIRLRGKLNDMARAYGDLALVVSEQAHHRGGAATRYAAGYQAIVDEWCEERKLEYTTIHSATLKKWATGKGNADKDLMRRMAADRFPHYQGGSDDEADALWILDYALKVIVAGERR